MHTHPYQFFSLLIGDQQLLINTSIDQLASEAIERAVPSHALLVCMDIGKAFLVGNLVICVTVLNLCAQLFYFWAYILRR